MCINPNLIWIERGPKWEQQPVACRQCWRCNRNRVNDYVGRAMAEASTSYKTVVLNMTYAPRDDLADKILHPSHFQLFMKRLRRAGHEVRYLVAGEYGDLRGRAHFHAILFFKSIAERNDAPPPSYNWGHIADPETSSPFSEQVPHQRMIHIREWPHGHITADWSMTEKAVRYVCKYLLNDNKNNAWFSLSKKPALGAEFFARKAEQARELGVLPSSFNYLPPAGSTDKQYFMTGATRRDYLNAITIDPEDRRKMSEWVLATFDKQHAARIKAALDAQPLEVLEQAFNEYREIRDEQERIQRTFRYLASVDQFNDLLDASENGILRKQGRNWVPE